MEENKIMIVPKAKNYEMTFGGNTSSLKRNVDFGTLKKKDGSVLTTKPTLFKSGAEKILRIMGVPYDIILNDTFKDHEKGYFYYEVLARVSDQNGRIVRCGVGCANTNEKGSGSASGFDIANSAIKKAKKRAIVDLAISMADASDWFTQDIEDQANSTIAREVKSDKDTIDKDRQEQLFAVAQTNGYTIEEIKAIIKSFGYDKSSDIILGDYDRILAKFSTEKRGE